MSASLLAALEATWRPAETREAGPWRLRRGAGGGNRVSAATALGPEAAATIPAAEAAMRAWGQMPLVQVREGEAALDAALAARGWRVTEPVVLLAAPAADLARLDRGGFDAIACAAPLARMKEIWAEGGAGPARLAVMARSGTARTWLLARAGDRPAGVAFVATHGPVAMLHAVHVLPEARRQGAGRALVARAASWALGEGAATLGLAVGEGNGPARALYEGLGMAVAGRYHYREAPEGDPR